MRYQSVRLRDIKHHKWLILRSILGTGGIICNYYAIDHLILSDSNIIFRLTTIILLLTSWVFLKEKVSKRRLVAIFVAFVGVVFVVKPAFSVEFIPYLVAIGGATFAALAYTTLRVVGQKEHFMAIVFYFATFTFIVLLPYVIYNYQPMTMLDTFYVVTAGFCAAIGQFGVTIAYKLAPPAKEVSIYNYFGVVFSAVLSVVIFSDLPDGLSILGYFIIFGASYYMFKLKAKESKV